MALLTERQQQAQSLAHEIQRMGGFVINPMPLGDKARLRFQVLDKDKNAIIEKLMSWNWYPIYCNCLPRVTPVGMEAASTYEVDLPPERQPIVDDRIYDSGRARTTAEVQATLEHIGWYGKRK